MNFATALSGDLDRSFPEIVNGYQDRLYRFGLRLTGNPQDAEEIAQEAFVRAYKWLRNHCPLNEDFRLQPWLYRVTLNVFRNRARRPSPSTLELEHASALAEADGKAPYLLAEQQETRAELASVLARLPLRYREAVVLRHIEELSYAEIGSVLSRPEGSVKSDVHRGLGMLRSALTEQQKEVMV